MLKSEASAKVRGEPTGSWRVRGSTLLPSPQSRTFRPTCAIALERPAHCRLPRSPLGLYQNETAELCQWHVNEAHYLEAWGDARAYDGTVSIVQPLIAPLYDGKSACEVVAMLSGQSDTKGHEIVQDYWKKQHPGADFDTFWRKSLHDGWVEGTAFVPKQVGNKTAGSSRPRRALTTRPSKSTSAAILPSTTDNSPTTAGCRNCPSR